MNRDSQMAVFASGLRAGASAADNYFNPTSKATQSNFTLSVDLNSVGLQKFVRTLEHAAQCTNRGESLAD